MFERTMHFKQRLQLHYGFLKPGIVYANVLTAAAGYLFASSLTIAGPLFISLLAGTGLLIMGACAANNIIDRRRDIAMSRTARRGLVTGQLSLVTAGIWAVGASFAGLGLLIATQNTVTVTLLLVAYFDYVVLYSIFKRYSVHSTLVGCVSGALPLIAGYTAATNRLDVTAALLFLLMVAWQMAHFFGIALYRYDDYKSANFPIISVRRGPARTRKQAVGYVLLFIATSIGLIVQSAIGVVGSCLLLAAGVWWLLSITRGTTDLSDVLWGKRLFLRSLTVVTVMTVSLAGGTWLW